MFDSTLDQPDVCIRRVEAKLREKLEKERAWLTQPVQREGLTQWCQPIVSSLSWWFHLYFLHQQTAQIELLATRLISKKF